MTADITLIDPAGRRTGLTLATNPQTREPLWSTGTLRQVQPSVQIAEASYGGSFDPNTEAIWAQLDLSGGIGKAIQVPATDPQAKRYRYAEWMDLSVAGQIGKGPAVTTRTAPANAGTLTGGFELGGNFYLVLGRRIARYDAGTLTAVADAGGGGAYAGAATFWRMGAETSGESAAGATTQDSITGPDIRLAQMIRSSASGLVLLTRVDLTLLRTGTILSTPAAPRVTTFGTAAAATVGYKIVGRSTVGTTIASAEGTIATANGTLSGTNGISLTWTAVIGAVAYDVYRSTGGPSQGKISTTSSLTLSDTGLAGDGTTAPVADTSLDLPGPVTLGIHGDRDGQPSTDPIIQGTVDGNTVPTSAGAVSFRFPDADAPTLLPGEPVWLVLSCDAADGNVGLGWRVSGSNTYTRGPEASTTDGGDTWTTAATGRVFTCYTRTPTRTAFVGASDGSTLLQTTTDGSSYAADSYRAASLVVVVGDTLVRDQTNVGAVQFSADGRRWDEALSVGDPTVPITDLQALAADTLVVCKQDGIFCVDLGSTPAVVQQVYGTGRSVVGNGTGSAVFQGACYIPWDGALLALSGSFSGGFTVDDSVGVESLPEWDAPWGAGRHVACAAGRHHLYSVVSATNGYRLLKAATPRKRTSDGTPDPDWHGSICSIPDGGQTLNRLVVWDPGGTGSPRLFASTTGNDLAEIVLSRTANPFGDPSYLLDTANTGKVFYPTATGNFPLHPKALVAEAATFLRAVGGDHVDVLYDLFDGQGYRLLGRASDTDVLSYPTGATARLLGRQMRMTNASAATCPLVVALGLAFAIRPPVQLKLRTLTFTLEVEDGMAQGELSSEYGTSAETVGDTLARWAGSGTWALEGPDREAYDSVLLTDLRPAAVNLAGRKRIECHALQVR